ncbi:MAG TPA: hypothetical protein VGJ03_13230 [Acidimicrobiales bacterium]|jgi:hypothetical protein
MYLFSREARLGPGNPVEQGAWAVSVTEKVNQISEVEVQLWTRVLSPGLGTFAWTASVEELSELEASDAKLLADSTYVDLVAQGAKYESGQGINDSLLQMVYPDPDAANGQPQYVSVVDAVIAPGNTSKAVDAAIEVAQAAKRVSGRPTSFAVGASGPYGGVAWITVYDSIEQLQKAGEDIAADASFGAQVDKLGPLFLPEGTTQLFYRRIA